MHMNHIPMVSFFGRVFGLTSDVGSETHGAQSGAGTTGAAAIAVSIGTVMYIKHKAAQISSNKKKNPTIITTLWQPEEFLLGWL